MRVFSMLLMTALCLVLGIEGCSKDNTTTPTTEEKSFFTCLVDGVSFSADQNLIVSRAGLLQIFADDMKSDRVHIALYDVSKPTGEFAVQQFPVIGDFSNGVRSYISMFANTAGVLKITTNTDDVLEGTFSFKGATDPKEGPQTSVNITEGKFKIFLKK